MLLSQGYQPGGSKDRELSLRAADLARCVWPIPMGRPTSICRRARSS
jgi:hypothetical protein